MFIYPPAPNNYYLHCFLRKKIIKYRCHEAGVVMYRVTQQYLRAELMTLKRIGSIKGNNGATTQSQTPISFASLV
jgi:hypothetical protein